MTPAEERQHVVLAHTVELNVTHHHHVVRALREERAVDGCGNASRVAFEQELVGLGNARGRAFETLAIRVLAYLD